jgi:hypothetical protein
VKKKLYITRLPIEIPFPSLPFYRTLPPFSSPFPRPPKQQESVKKVVGLTSGEKASAKKAKALEVRKVFYSGRMREMFICIDGIEGRKSLLIHGTSTPPPIPTPPHFTDPSPPSIFSSLRTRPRQTLSSLLRRRRKTMPVVSVVRRPAPQSHFLKERASRLLLRL